MNILKIFVLSAVLTIFVTFPVVAKDHTPTPTQMEKVLTAICGEQITSECLDTFLKSKDAENRAALSAYELARDILGDDFIIPNEIAQARNMFYSDVQLAEFKNTLPSREVLEWLKANDYMLVAGPPTKLSLLDVYRLKSSSKSGEVLYTDDSEQFYRTDTVDHVWLALRKGAVPNSINKTWDEQQALLSNSERVPNVTEVVWGFTTYKEVRGVDLTNNDVYVRTSSVPNSFPQHGFRVMIGSLKQNRLYVSYSIDFFGYLNLGLSSARKSWVLNP